jgi:hypothetical protein
VNPLIWLALLSIGVYLAWDWLVKKRRIAQRPEINDQDFLRLYRGPKKTVDDSKVLELRLRIARELGIPASKLTPQDELVYLRDCYSLIVSGHLALSDLLDDLETDRRESSLTPACPETIREYIAAALLN